MDIIDDILIDEEMEIVQNIQRRPYNTRNRFFHVNNFDTLDDVDFIRRFRLSKETVQQVLVLIEDEITPISNRNNPISPMQQLLVTLRFFATGSFYVCIGDFTGMHKTTAANIIKRTTSALSRLRPQFIHLPTTEAERTDVKVKFQATAMFPRVLGALDCTHIRIQSPGGPNAENFRNRKGFFSLNVQVVSDADYCIRDLVTRWPGSSHDANIFDNSLVRMRFENNEMGDGLLLGDSAYPLRRYLLTPLNNPQGEVKNLFNESLIRTRIIVERTFGIWKRRFPVLSIGMRCNLDLVQEIIFATAILHNIACRNRENQIPGPEDELPLDEIPVIPANNIQNNNHRRELLEYFRQLHNGRN